MKILKSSDAPQVSGDSDTFVGPVQIQRLGQDAEGVPVTIYRVEFSDGGRTNWHAHSGPQWLLVTQGRIRVQSWDGPAQEAAAGDAVVIAPHEKHWHGAAPGAPGTHLAVNVNFTTEWMEPVSEDQYLSGSPS